MALGNEEAHANWLDFLQGMLSRGLQAPVLVVTDGTPGRTHAVEGVLSRSLRKPCLAHKVRHVIPPVPDSARRQVEAAVQAIYYALN